MRNNLLKMTHLFAIRSGTLSDVNTLLIYTRFRSGSSFTGSLFSHHPHVYYLFEAMKFVEHSRNKNDLHEPEVVSQRIREVFSCQFQSLLAFTTQPRDWIKVKVKLKSS